MKFLCLDCDEPMKLLSTEGPDEGSLAVTFRCPECGFRVAMLTNAFETQMVRSLGVKVGGAGAPSGPFEHLRASMAAPRPDAFVEAPDAARQTTTAGASTEAGASLAGTESGGPGCPFAAMVNQGEPAATARVVWTPEAEARVERVPSFIRAMARRAIERFAEGQGYTTITEAVMDEARGAFGM